MYRLLISFLLLQSTVLFASAIEPLPNNIRTDPAKVALGKALFSDTILSKDNTVSCATCHNLAEGGDDNLPFSFGIKGQKGSVNSPTVYNAVFNFRQFWDGRAADLEEQALAPIENPLEMGNNFKNLIQVLKKTSYQQKFLAIYTDGITKNNIANAIAEFEKTLITANAPFDKFLLGNKNAISNEAKEGYEIFKQKGCIACHHGINVGGNLYNKFGIMRDTKSKNLGRYNVTKRERDKYFFKVPSLRNVALTAPYFHDGRHNSLRDAVKEMAFYQLGRPISESEISKIIAFLKSLNGEIPQSAL